MNKIFKIGMGLAGALTIAMMAQQAYATLTLGATSASSDAALTLQGAGNTLLTTSSGNLDLDAATSLYIATTTASTIVIGNITSATALTLQGGTGGVTATSTGPITVVSNKNAASAISLTANAGTTETILIKSWLGNTASAINIVSAAGGITLNASGAVAITNNATVGGTLGVTGNATFGGTLGVTGFAAGNTVKLFKVATTTPANDYFLAVMGNGNVSSSSSPPTFPASQGAGALLLPGSTNVAGTIMVGGVLVSSTTITFVPPFTNTPSCVANLSTGTPLAINISASATPTTLKIVAGSGLPAGGNITNGVVTYHCWGNGE